MKKYLFVIALLAASTTLAQVKQTVAKWSVSYEIKNMGINTSGVFEKMQADIDFDEQHLATSSIEAYVETASLNSDNAMRDKHLKSEDYFDAVKYPHITLKSLSFKHKGGNNYTGVFNVTIKDKTKALEVPFTYTDSGSAAVFKGAFKINRLDFGVGGSSLVLANEATISVTVETTK